MLIEAVGAAPEDWVWDLGLREIHGRGVGFRDKGVGSRV